MEVVEACVRKGGGGMFLRTVERMGREPESLPQGYKDKQFERLGEMRDALFVFANERFDICPQFELPINTAERERQAFRISLDLWDNPSTIGQFTDTKGDSFSCNDLETIASWKDVLAGPMYCMETYGDKALILCDGYVFEAVSFGRTWDDMIPYAPDLVITSLVPFEEAIALGGFTTRHYCPMVGAGLGRLNEEYRRALDRGVISDSQQFRIASQEIRLLRQSRGIEPNSWFAYMDFVDEINDLTADSCRPYETNARLWEQPE